MDVSQYLNRMSLKRKRELAILFAKKAMPVWDSYATSHLLKYRDSVVGLHHVIEQDLLNRSIDAVEHYLKAKPKSAFAALFVSKSTFRTLRKEFREPEVALQDDDWELPDSVKYAFYAVLNLLDDILGERQTEFGNQTVDISIKQAAGVLLNEHILTKDELKNIMVGND